MNSFHARDGDDISGAVVFSFGQRWETLLRNNQISVFFRRKVPTRVRPKLAYIYVGSPTSAVIGFAKIFAVESVLKSVAFSHSGEGQIQESVLKEYIGSRDSINMIRIDKLQLFSTPIALNALQSIGAFHPPQSFFFVSGWGVETLNALGNLR